VIPLFVPADTPVRRVIPQHPRALGSSAASVRNVGVTVIAVVLAPSDFASATPCRTATSERADPSVGIKMCLYIVCLLHPLDLIVTASHGHKGVAALVLGSETTKVLTHSKIPVLVCR
jgi:Universal stress protein family